MDNDKVIYKEGDGELHDMVSGHKPLPQYQQDECASYWDKTNCRCWFKKSAGVTPQVKQDFWRTLIGDALGRVFDRQMVGQQP